MIETTTATSVHTDWVEYESNGATIQAYLAMPAPAGTWPAVILVHENPGLLEHRQDVTRRLARLGYVALTPNLYSRIGGKAPNDANDLERKRNIALATPDQQVLADILNGYRYLGNRPEADTARTGLFGFCMGGQKGFYAACHSDVFRCYVDFYGPVIARAELQPDRKDHSYLPYAANLSCPMQYHVGDQDAPCPLNDVEQLRAELSKHGKQAECFVYPGAQHAFHSDTEPRYHLEAAELAWKRAVDFLSQHLQSR
jgi:carboxymethylenebutenolidase